MTKLEMNRLELSLGEVVCTRTGRQVTPPLRNTCWPASFPLEECQMLGLALQVDGADPVRSGRQGLLAALPCLPRTGELLAEDEHCRRVFSDPCGVVSQQGVANQVMSRHLRVRGPFCSMASGPAER